MSTSPIVSVVMAVYNAEQYVAQTVESILTQTFVDFEFIILDDGSTDRSLKILEAYAAKDERIRLSTRANKGVSATRNEMLAKAEGEFIAVMDADDIALPERLALQVEFLQSHPDVVCVGGAHEMIDEKGRLLTRLELPLDNDEIQQMILAGHGAICHPCAMIRRTSMIEVGGYDEELVAAHDMDLWLKLGEIGVLVNMKETLLKYRLNTNSVSGKNYILQRRESQIACERAWKRRGIEGHFEATEPWRPGPDRSSQHKFILQYGWWAFLSGQRRTSITYATRAIAILPLAIEGWKLLACAALKPLPISESTSSR